MKIRKSRVAREEGQSIVILAVAMVGLLAFAGLAVDAGVIYSGSVRLARAVDAAALAGVVELPDEETGTEAADKIARQFLAANEIWPTAEISGTTFFQSSRQGGSFGTVRYLVTATHQVDLYFLPLVNFRYVRLRDSAVAEYNALVNMYANQAGNYGLEQTANLSIFGPRICTCYGDAYTPETGERMTGEHCNDLTANPWHPELDGIYHFQISIPADYTSKAQSLTEVHNGGTDTNDVLRVEIWDPDSYNRSLPGNQFVITNTTTLAPMTISNACPGGGDNRIQPCVPLLGTQDPQNRFGFVRIDENRGHGTPPGDGQCGLPTTYTPGYNTVTRYTLYYYRKRADGSLERRDLARYTKGGAESDSDTDMLWVSPGGSLPGDPLPDGWAGSPYGFAWDAGNGNFEIDLSSEAPDIYVSPADGTRSLFLDVEGREGASENGFDLWAGPRYRTVPSEVNARNVDILLHPGDYHSSAGATVFGIGHLPMNSNATEVVTLTLTWIPQEWGGRTMRVGAFDNDVTLATGVTFIFNTMPYDDWHHDGRLSGDGVWYTNVFTLPSEPEDTFYGGFLQAVYNAGATDTFGWKMTTEGIPWLVE